MYAKSPGLHAKVAAVGCSIFVRNILLLTSGKTEIIALIQAGKVVEIAAATIEGEGGALFGDDIEIVSSRRCRSTCRSLLRRQTADMS
jgi:hypothetical protein